MEPRYKIHVEYPYGGIHYVLAWYEYYEGSNIILARKESQVAHILQRVVERHGAVEIKQYVRLNIVAPHDEIVQAYDARERKGDAMWYFRRAIRNIQSYEKKFGGLPDGLKKCTDYKHNTDIWGEPPSAFDEEGYEHDHYYCKNCYEGLLFSDGKTVEQFYEEGGQKAADLVYSERIGDHKIPTSRAGKADPSKPLYRTNGYFGDHREGVVINDDNDVLIVDRTLFFYQDPEDIDRSALEAVVLARKNEEEAAQALRDAEHDIRCAKADEEDLVDVLRFFPPKK